MIMSLVHSSRGTFPAPRHMSNQILTCPVDLTRPTTELLAEHEELRPVVDGEYTGTSDTTEDVGTCTLEERPDTFCSNDLAGRVHGTLVLDSL